MKIDFLCLEKKKMKKRIYTMTRSNLRLEELPASILMTIFALARAPRAAAQTCRRFRDIVMDSSYIVKVIAANPDAFKEFAQSRVLERKSNITACQIHFMYQAPPALSYYSGSSSLLDLSLWFLGGLPTRRSYINLSRFQALRSLTLGASSSDDDPSSSCRCSSSDPTRRINLDGGIASLSHLPYLRDLALFNLGSEKGLERLHQVTSLRIEYPNHGEAKIDEFFCEACQAVHMEEIFNFLGLINFVNSVSVGPAISRMKSLKTLTLDFNTNLDVSRNPYLNVFSYGTCSKRSSLNASATNKKRQDVFWPRLETVNIVRVGSSRGIFNNIPIGQDAVDHVLLPVNETGGSSMWEKDRVWEAFKCMPELKAWRIWLDISDSFHMLQRGEVEFSGPESEGACPMKGDYVCIDDTDHVLEVYRPAALSKTQRSVSAGALEA